MSVVTSWIALKGADAKAAVFEELGFVDTGEEAGQWELSYGETPSGWLIIALPTGETIDDEDMAALSAESEAMMFALDERTMFSLAEGYIDGVKQWSVGHEGSGKGKGVFHLKVVGSPPP